MSLKRILYISCLIVVILEVVLKLMHPGHVYFKFEEIPAFGSLVGFLGALFIVIIAKSLSKIVTKREDYYD